MKKIIALVLSFVLLFAIYGCKNKTSADALKFYYPRAEYTFAEMDSVIASELVYPEKGAQQKTLLTMYLQGPADPDLVRLFPSGTKVIACNTNGKVLHIMLSDQVCRLSGIQLSLALAAMTLTCIDLFQIDSVTFSAESGLLDGQKEISMDTASILRIDPFPGSAD